MKSIFGVFLRSGNDASPETVSGMLQRMAAHGGTSRIACNDGVCGLGHFDPAAAFGQGEPAGCSVPGQAFAFSCAARLDNRAEIGRDLGLSAKQASATADSDLIRAAYAKWDERCIERLYGDWSFVCWHPGERRLFLARDHFGITSLFYYLDSKVFAFASSRESLLALKLSPLELDKLYLAQVITSWPAYHGERSVYPAIRRLPPAHRLSVSPGNSDVRQYWHLERVPETRLSGRQEYVEAFRELFDDAVRARLRSADGSDAAECSVASTLSGGLDSGSVTATAAGFLARENRRVSAFTSAPLLETANYMPSGRFGDELSLARATAGAFDNVDIHQIRAEATTPVGAIRSVLKLRNEPVHSAGNLFWILDLWRAVQANGDKVLLLGQFGNAGASWAGCIQSQPLSCQLRQLGCLKLAKDVLKRNLPAHVLSGLRKLRRQPQSDCLASAINPALAADLDLFERRSRDPDCRPPRTALDHRMFLMPGRSSVGALHAELGAAFGLEVRDPTADVRLLEFTFSVPDHVFIDRETGMDRWLIREAMKGRLPDSVRLNRDTGCQAGDLVPRLRASAAEVEAVLIELARGPAAEYVDVAHMRRVWREIQTRDTPESFRKAVSILTRGMMAGLFVNDFYAKNQ